MRGSLEENRENSYSLETGRDLENLREPDALVALAIEDRHALKVSAISPGSSSAIPFACAAASTEGATRLLLAISTKVVQFNAPSGPTDGIFHVADRTDVWTDSRKEIDMFRLGSCEKKLMNSGGGLLRRSVGEKIKAYCYGPFYEASQNFFRNRPLHRGGSGDHSL